MIFRASLSFKYLNFAAFSTTLLIGVKLQKPIYADFVQKYNPTIQQEQKEFKPISVVKSDERKQSSIGFIIRLLRDDWLLFSSIILVTATSAAAAVYTPIAIGKLVSAIQTLEDINLPAIEIGALFISQGLLTFLDISLVTKLGESLASTLRIKVFDALIRKDQSYLDSKTSAEIQSLQADIQELKSVLKKTITKGLSAGFQIVGSILSLLGTSVKLTFTLVTFLPFVYLGMSLYGRYLRKLSSICRKVEEDSMFHLGQVYSNLKTVRAFVAEDSETKVFKNHVSRVNQSNLWLGINIGAFQSLVIGSIGSAVLGVLYFGGNLVLDGEMTGGQLISFMVQTQNTQKALSSIGVLFSQFLKSLTSAERLKQYIVYENEIPLRGGLYPESFDGQIEFKNVYFTYPTRNSPILKDFSLNVKNGSIISLCGKSGLGKSTVGQVLSF
jgi:ATP-binding cassette subfamily B (MDR/TAP) protein 8